MICQLCRNERKLIKAHIIPEFIYRDLGLYSSNINAQGRIHGYENSNGIIKKLVKGLPLGLYDPHILCEDCDSIILKELDDFGKEILRKLLQSKKTKSTRYIEIKTVDYILFKKFFASIFWRASISKRREFSIVDFRDLEPIFRDLFYKKALDYINDFEIVIIYMPTGLPESILSNIVKVEKQGIYFYSFVAGGFAINFFPDKKKVVKGWEDFCIKNIGLLKIPIINDFDASKTIINSIFDNQIIN